MITDDIIFAKLSDTALSPDEERLFEEWYALPENRAHYEMLMRERAAAMAAMTPETVDMQTAWARFEARNRRRPAARRRTMRWSVAAAAAAVIVVGMLLFDRTDAPMETVHPATFRAVLTLSTGEQIMLSDGVETFEDNGARISIESGNALTYSTEDITGAPESFNTVLVPRGGFFRVELSDGTVVWLNSETRLRYPVTFGAAATRTVELTGEAYFAVAKNDAKPFIVRTEDYDIRVTGTEFNVRSYMAENTATTLVSGAVEITCDGRISALQAGQQATLCDGRVAIAAVDTGDYTAWRNGEFSFRLSRLGEIMDELQRWYDLNVVFDDPALREMRFSAWFSRHSDIEEIFGILEKTNRISLTLRGTEVRVKGK
ncbi:MAG: FecR domain-containing protein [Rikenellaceae bacterium]|nr:FecR domain-containing protein [Rikenellaceae bacterium]MCL2692144.1 FecR domain-containing protein [Rikenellaceae bacterium]